MKKIELAYFEKSFKATSRRATATGAIWNIEMFDWLTWWNNNPMMEARYEKPSAIKVCRIDDSEPWTIENLQSMSAYEYGQLARIGQRVPGQHLKSNSRRVLAEPTLRKLNIKQWIEELKQQSA